MNQLDERNKNAIEGIFYLIKLNRMVIMANNYSYWPNNYSAPLVYTKEYPEVNVLLLVRVWFAKRGA